MTIGIVVFVLVLTFSIALHELGHLATAKFFGMKATRYFIGFGPTLWSTHRGETEYGLKAFPVGGFVKIVGMTPLEELDDPDDQRRAFYKAPAAQRAVVLAAGSTMHFLLAVVLVFIALTTFGVERSDRPTTTIEAVATCAKPDDPCKDGDAPSPALAAGFKAGDRLLLFDGRPVESWREDLSEQVRTRAAGPVEIVVERDGERKALTASVVRVQRKNADGELEEAGYLGLVPRPTVERYGVVGGAGRTVQVLAEFVKGTADAIVGLPGQIPDLVRQVTSDEARDGTGAASLIGAGRAAGQANESGNQTDLIALLAGINVFIGIFNLLPLLPLDGGHLAVLWFEEFRSWVARLRKRPNPGRVDLTKLMPLTYVFLFLLISLQVLVLYADIANPIPDPFTQG